jgi:2-oxoglutarate dehydrogenase E1 component
VLLCSGKLYYDLIEQREKLDRRDVAVVRLEQLYPLATSALRSVLAEFGDGTPVTWVQEEPENMGAWQFLFLRFGGELCGRYPFSGIFRAESASPATGSKAAHKREQQQLIDRAFGGE